VSPRDGQIVDEADTCPPNFRDAPPGATEAPLTAVQACRRAYLDALGLPADELIARIVDLETDLATVRELLSVTLEHAAIAEARNHHLSRRIAALVQELRALPSARRVR